MKWIEKIQDWWLEVTLPRSHRRRIQQGRRTLEKLKAWLACNEPHAEARTFAYLRKIDPLVFEELTLEAFHRAGHRIRRGRRYSGDGGADGYVMHAGRWCPVQCKRYASHINSRHVADFIFVVERCRAPRGYFIHTGRTGAQSRETVRDTGTQIVMVSGQRLIDLLLGAAHFALR